MGKSEVLLLLQTMPVETDPADIGFDPLDDTKVRPFLWMHWWLEAC